jgi:ribonuclease VapC
MVVDASAVLAILLQEDDREVFEDALAGADGWLMSAINYWEVRTRAQIKLGDAGVALAEALLANAGVRIVDADAAASREAAAAFERYRGRPARLNLGDSFAYALARREGDGLLFKGDDFSRTDIKPALGVDPR